MAAFFTVKRGLRPARAGRSWNWTCKLGAIGLGLLAGLLLAELLTRVLRLGGTHISRGALHAFDPRAGWTCLPGANGRLQNPASFDVEFHCNSRGLRGSEEHPYKKPPGVRRIVVLGDSFMWGWGVEDRETMASCLEERLEATETVNFGTDGYSAVQSLVRLEEEGMRYSPDVVTYAFCKNDLAANLYDNEGGSPIVHLDGAAVSIANCPVRRPWKSPKAQWFRRHSRLVEFVEYSTERAKAAFRSRAASRLRADEIAAANRSRVERERAGSELYLSFLDLYGVPSRRANRPGSRPCPRSHGVHYERNSDVCAGE
jgi:lysophospholipase L1-like esterase